MTIPPAVTIIDDFLGEEAWTSVWSALQFTDLLPVTRGSGAWKLDDGVPLGGEETIVPREVDPAQLEGDIAPVLGAVLAAGEQYADQVTGEWDRVSARIYVYPAGTGLSWHVDDSELYTGAFVYYAHPHWNAHWGGELMLAEAPEDMPIMAYRFASEEYSERLLEAGEGCFIAPKPNRLVVLSGAPHQVAPVRAAAGDHVRATVCGFFLKPSVSP